MGNLRADFAFFICTFAPVLPPGLAGFLATFWAVTGFVSIFSPFWAVTEFISTFGRDVTLAAECGAVIPAAPLRFLPKLISMFHPFYVGGLYGFP